MSTTPRHLGKYDLRELLGRGGMGEVWKAYDTQLQRYVAIKLLHADLQSDPGFTARFQREAQVIASLHHPNIVQIFDFQVSQTTGPERTIFYMVMDCIEGQTLATYIHSTSRIGKFPNSVDIVHLFTPIALAIDYAHQKGMIHRDIKPGNILLDKRDPDAKHSLRSAMGEPVLSDFGLARLLGTHTNTLSLGFGTPHYISPEQALGTHIDAQSDIYSLGVVLYEVCTGVRPFSGDNVASIVMQHINATPPPPAFLNPAITSPLTSVIMRSLAKDPSARFSSAASMAIAIAEALNHPVPERLWQAISFSDMSNERTELSSKQEPHTPTSLAVPLESKRADIHVVGVPKTPPPMLVSQNSAAIVPPSIPVQEKAQYAIVQVYVEGETLERYLERLNQPMAEKEILLYASQVLDILNGLHRQMPPIVHGDIKPANILLGTRDKRAHLIGFSTVSATPDKQISEPVSVDYAPPEQLQGRIDPRSDLYALAATMHHLLTNRDPRKHTPFAYPPARLLSPYLSLESERILTCALTNDITYRYQNATEMKHDIDDVLQKQYGLSSNRSDYPSGVSVPTVGADASIGDAKNVPFVTKVVRRLRPNPQSQGVANAIATKQVAGTQPPVLPESQPIVGWRGSSPQPMRAATGLVPPLQQGPRKNKRRRNIILALLALLVIIALLFLTLFPWRPTTTSQKKATTPLMTIGVTKAPDGELIGISDGSFAFDTQLPDSDLKVQAAERLRAKDYGSAVSLWQQALTKETSDAETLIYLENQRVLNSGVPYITIVVGTTLTGPAGSIAVGRESTHAAYVAQKEYNSASKLPRGMNIRLLIANSGGNNAYTTGVAQQIVNLAQVDKTVIGVMGWTSAAATLNVIGTLSAAKIPMVTNSGSDSLTGMSSYFFRVTLPASLQGHLGAEYSEQTFHAQTAVIFNDVKNDFARSLAKGFSERFTSDGNTILATESYTVGDGKTLSAPIQDALSKHADMLYFAGYSADVGLLLAQLQPSDPPVIGGSSLYQLGGYPAAASKGLSHLRFTAYSYPDEWDILEAGVQKPAFFADYRQAFDPEGLHKGSPYGYTRPDGTTIELYDAMSAMLYGVSIALGEKGNSITGTDLRQALATITGKNALQGAAGQISFGPDSNPINHMMLVLCYDKSNHIKLDAAQGQFLVGDAQPRQLTTFSVCR